MFASKTSRPGQSRWRGVSLALATVLLTGGCGFLIPDGPDSPSRSGGLAVRGSDAFAPYLDFGLGQPEDVAPVAWDNGIKRINLGFIGDQGGCTPQWNGLNILHDRANDGRLAAMRAIHADLRVSFGGASGTELAADCGDADDLAAAYQRVIDDLGVGRVDFDLENQALADAAVVERRNLAIKKLQDTARARGRFLDVTYTLPATPAGLDVPAEAAVRGAVAAGVAFSAVNLLAMDYGGVTGNLGHTVIGSANGLRAQLGALLPGESDGELWKKVAVTAMIGHNDDEAEVFDLDDARAVADFAAQKHLGWLSVWSLSRDFPCSDSTHHDKETCSGVDQQPYEFSRIFGRYRG